MALGATLRRVRKNQRMTLVQVSEQTNLSISFLSDIERGKANPSLESLKKLAPVYGFKVEELERELERERDSADKFYPPGFTDFLSQFDDVDEGMQQLLLEIENHSASRPQSKEDWIQLYYSVKTILRQ